VVSQIYLPKKRELGNVTVMNCSKKIIQQILPAVAAILFSKGETFFTISAKDFNVITVVDVKIKVNKEGYDWANAVCTFYIEAQVLKMLIFKAVTYNLVGGQIENRN
jgi:hypothetical protein